MRRSSPSGPIIRQESGAALLVILIILLVVIGSAASFIWFMNQQQTRAGDRLRRAVAVAVAEAGIYRALAILESVTPDRSAPGRTWRPRAYSEPITIGPLEGRFTVSLADAPGGAVLITSTGEVGGATRRVRARVHLASRALLAGIYGATIVRLEAPPAATSIGPYGAGPGRHPWVHIAAGDGLWMASAGVSLNDPSARPVTGPGPVDAPDATRRTAATPEASGLRLLLAASADLRVDDVFQPLDVRRLQAMGFPHEITVVRVETLPAPPTVDRAFYQARATANIGNADLNRAAGKYTGDGTLERKRDSLYSAEEFERLLRFLRAERKTPRLHGIIYVTGRVVLQSGQGVEIAGGTLATEGPIHLEANAVLHVSHSPATRTLPAIIALEKGELLLAGGARLRAHGLIYLTQVFELTSGADADIVGAILGGGRGFSFVNTGARAVIRYDPAVLGTPGLQAVGDEPVVAWVASWEEVP
ncbi:MAG: hypothetical protein QN131_03935 [Armatimonadota bacterium]|nr:hypothetical protein [Armatimonadota bacterium]